MKHEKKDLTSDSVGNYFKGRRTTIAENISKGANRILDVGCGAGLFGAYLKLNGYAEHVTGIEINQKAADEASTNLDNVYCRDLNKTSISDVLKASADNQFDYITCNDVLEHLVNPWQVLKDLSNKLSPEGEIIASIPNVRHWTVLLPLMFRGRWDYQDSGIMDRTHLRFFTKNTMQQLFESAGLKVHYMHPLIGGKWKLVDKYSLHILRDFVTVQWVIVGTLKVENAIS